MSFSDRLGITKPKTVLQVDGIDDDLRNGLWQACLEFPLATNQHYLAGNKKFERVVRGIYVNVLKETSDEIPLTSPRVMERLKGWFYGAEWYDVYNLLEFLLSLEESSGFARRVSFFLGREKSGYRIIENKFVPITDPVEIREVAAAASLPSRFSAAREHIQTAIVLFSRKPQPDYRNSIKESISAVESIARVIADNPKATLGDALKVINDKIPMHPALKDAMSKLYGYTSDEGGIRHSLTEASNIDEAEAKFMIVACSAFVNFCVQRSA
ncbi:AbiJ-NTD4 domain-containing protein [Bradyrhizobium sp. AUGA SZCCT0283]|uniref:AbiJ-NTD4 domain-containing protein n=1 Tax=Bradyrhizobium sp. AUGA SZCCT0283 TaxID=2807671 RepID=UPI001BA9DA05|nr:hypothetical protein [Bradyrhizobium sp. AUGA SZCCT0283]MBR1278986.1 hypothetical protein [Bradyrhizobium sp. AUGA SZCCT0283]